MNSRQRSTSLGTHHTSGLCIGNPRYRIRVDLLLIEARYHVYYVPRGGEVRVLAVWHAQRGVGPPLRVS